MESTASATTTAATTATTTSATTAPSTAPPSSQYQLAVGELLKGQFANVSRIVVRNITLDRSHSSSSISSYGYSDSNSKGSGDNGNNIADSSLTDSIISSSNNSAGTGGSIVNIMNRGSGNSSSRKKKSTNSSSSGCSLCERSRLVIDHSNVGTLEVTTRRLIFKKTPPPLTEAQIAEIEAERVREEAERKAAEEEIERIRIENEKKKAADLEIERAKVEAERAAALVEVAANAKAKQMQDLLDGLSKKICNIVGLDFLPIAQVIDYMRNDMGMEIDPSLDQKAALEFILRTLGIEDESEEPMPSLEDTSSSAVSVADDVVTTSSAAPSISSTNASVASTATAAPSETSTSDPVAAAAATTWTCNMCTVINRLENNPNNCSTCGSANPNPPPPRAKSRSNSLASSSSSSTASTASSATVPATAAAKSTATATAVAAAWACDACTYENSGSSRICQLCETPRIMNSPVPIPPTGDTTTSGSGGIGSGAGGSNNNNISSGSSSSISRSSSDNNNNSSSGISNGDSIGSGSGGISSALSPLAGGGGCGGGIYASLFGTTNGNDDGSGPSRLHADLEERLEKLEASSIENSSLRYSLASQLRSSAGGASGNIYRDVKITDFGSTNNNNMDSNKPASNPAPAASLAPESPNSNKPLMQFPRHDLQQVQLKQTLQDDAQHPVLRHMQKQEEEAKQTLQRNQQLQEENLLRQIRHQEDMLRHQEEMLRHQQRQLQHQQQQKRPQLSSTSSTSTSNSITNSSASSASSNSSNKVKVHVMEEQIRSFLGFEKGVDASNLLVKAISKCKEVDIPFANSLTGKSKEEQLESILKFFVSQPEGTLFPIVINWSDIEGPIRYNCQDCQVAIATKDKLIIFEFQDSMESIDNKVPSLSLADLRRMSEYQSACYNNDTQMVVTHLPSKAVSPSKELIRNSNGSGSKPLNQNYEDELFELFEADYSGGGGNGLYGGYGSGSGLRERYRQLKDLMLKLGDVDQVHMGMLRDIKKKIVEEERRQRGERSGSGGERDRDVESDSQRRQERDRLRDRERRRIERKIRRHVNDDLGSGSDYNDEDDDEDINNEDEDEDRSHDDIEKHQLFMTFTSLMLPDGSVDDDAVGDKIEDLLDTFEAQHGVSRDDIDINAEPDPASGNTLCYSFAFGSKADKERIYSCRYTISGVIMARDIRQLPQPRRPSQQQGYGERDLRYQSYGSAGLPAGHPSSAPSFSTSSFSSSAANAFAFTSSTFGTTATTQRFAAIDQETSSQILGVYDVGQEDHMRAYFKDMLSNNELGSA